MLPRLLAMILPAVVLASSFGSARAAVSEADFQMKTASDLVDLCTVQQGDRLAPEAVSFCQGFAVGAYQTLAEQQAAMSHKLFCISEPTPSRNQAIANFVAWAKANPSVMSERPADAILHYLIQRYPCATR